MNRQRAVRVDCKALQAFAESAWKRCLQAPPNARTALREAEEINIVLVSDRKIAALHRRFLGARGPTDVITFAHGEIVISAETARKQAASFRSSLEDEFQLYVVHGLLHLHGYDDSEAAGEKEMALLQKKIRAAAVKDLQKRPMRPTRREILIRTAGHPEPRRRRGISPKRG